LCWVISAFREASGKTCDLLLLSKFSQKGNDVGDGYGDIFGLFIANTVVGERGFRASRLGAVIAPSNAVSVLR